VREALRRLEHERLIERDATRMIRVADPSQAGLEDLTLIEGALRGVAARLAAERATEAEAAAIQATYERAEELLNAPDAKRHAEELLVLSRRFHTLVDAASHNRTLIDMIATATAFDLAFRVKWSSHVHRSRDTVDPRQQQHHTIAMAIRARDGDLAEQTMREHIMQGSRAFLAVAAENDEGSGATGS
jgi:DNA-binding GntR family transcriptional regulator